MYRRSLLAVLSLLAQPLLHAQPAPQPRHKVSAAQLHEALSARFPLRLDLGGWAGLQVSAPALLLLPRRNRLGATLRTEASGAVLPPLASGEMDIAFQLRYEPRDRTLRALEPELLDLRWPALPPEFAQAVQQALPAFAREALGEFVLHQFTARELALPDTMGFQPETITVVDDGLVIGFGRKR